MSPGEIKLLARVIVAALVIAVFYGLALAGQLNLQVAAIIGGTLAWFNGTPLEKVQGVIWRAAGRPEGISEPTANYRDVTPTETEQDTGADQRGG